MQYPKHLRAAVLASILAIIFTSAGYAQDHHFSQFSKSPFSVNPTLMLLENKFKTYLHYRNQWASAVRPYTTYQLTSQYPFKRNSLENAQPWSVAGLSFRHDRSGKNAFVVSNQVEAAYAYELPFLRGPHNLGVSAQIGFIHKRVDKSELRSGSQWANGSYNASADLGENFQNESIGIPKISGGLMWQFREEGKRTKYYSGVSFFNINQPEERYLAKGSQLAMRFSWLAGGTVYETEDYRVDPEVIYSRQASAQEFVGGSYVRYKLGEFAPGFLEKGTIGAGAFYRASNEAYITLELVQPKYEVGVSYDVNFSSLSRGKTGAPEIYLALKLSPEIKQSQSNTVKAEPDKEQKEEKKERVTYLKVVVEDKETGEFLYDTEVGVTQSENGKKYEHELIDSSHFAVKLPLNKEFSVKASHDGYLPVSKTFKTKRKDTVKVALDAKEVREGKDIVLDAIHFETDSDNLRSSSFTELDNLVEYLKDNTDQKVLISGHTDDRGKASYNKDLSKDRAQSVVEYLKKKGIDQERLKSKGQGESKPIAPNDSKEGRAKNRRVEMKVVEDFD